MPNNYSDIEKNRGATNFKKLGEINFRYRMNKMSNFIKTLLLNSKGYQKHKYNFYGNDENESNNWWTKYFASIQVDTIFKQHIAIIYRISYIICQNSYIISRVFRKKKMTK